MEPDDAAAVEPSDVHADAGESDEAEIALPDAVRARVVSIAAEALPLLPADEMPAALRKFATFAPARRAKLAGPAIGAQLIADPLFRQRLAARVVASATEHVSTADVEAAAADPVDLAAVAWLARPAGWTELVRGAADAMAEAAERESSRARDQDVRRLNEQLTKVRSSAKADTDRLRTEIVAARRENDELRVRARELTKAVQTAGHDARKAADALSTERGRAAAATSSSDAELRRLRNRVADLEAELDAAKHAAKEGRSADEARLWLLLETLGNAARGLRRELAVSPPEHLPADLIADAVPTAEPGTTRTWAADEPGQVDRLLALPQVHLIVDGYNVTKTGFGELALEHQRNRLVAALAGLAARTAAEATVVFDGAERLPVTPLTPRGVRVLFSPPGQTADEMIRRLVGLEPPGRPIVVVSTDREVADGVRRAGAYPVPSAVFLRLLGGR